MIIPIFYVFSTQIFHHLLVQYTRRSSADTELPLVCGELHHNYLLITLPAFHVTLFLSDRPRTENRYNDRLLHSIISSVFFPPSWKNMPPLPLQTDHSIDPFFETQRQCSFSLATVNGKLQKLCATHDFPSWMKPYKGSIFKVIGPDSSLQNTPSWISILTPLLFKSNYL